MSVKPALVLLVMAAAGAPAWSASDTDVSWIGKLPGLQAQAGRTTSTKPFMPRS